MGYVYPHDAKQDVLTRLARNSGRVTKTLNELSADTKRAYPVPSEKTLYNWQGEQEYQALRKEFERTIDEELGEDLTAEARGALDFARRIREEADSALDDKKYNAVRDLSTGYRNALTGVGIANQNSRVNREKPLGILDHEHNVNLTLVQKAIARLEAELTVDAETTGEEIHEAELVSGDE